MKKVGVLLPFESERQKNMIEAIGQALELELVYCQTTTGQHADAWIFPNARWNKAHAAHVLECKSPTYTVVHKSQLGAAQHFSEIEFENHDTIPDFLKGRTVDVRDAISLQPFIEKRFDHASVVATKAKRSVWEVVESHGHLHHVVSIPIPELEENEFLFSHFNEDRMIRLLPLLHFLKAISQEAGWAPPALKACFMFDDPNLHWPTYGFIDFRKMANSAIEHNYHVSFATIPLDGWYIHQPTAALFKKHADQLSLLVHGVNHISQELGRDYSDRESEALLSKGLERIANLERKSGVNVARVMAPPHGACSDKLLEQMTSTGFEAASISFGSLRRYNAKAQWLRRIGIKSFEVIGGLPVFARFPISSKCRNTVLEAAYLNRPIILMGHHKNVADGLAVLEELARFINSLGDVEWTDMAHIARAHYLQRVEGDTLHVRNLTHHIEVKIPHNIRNIVIENASSNENPPEILYTRNLDKGTPWINGSAGESIPVESNQKIAIKTIDNIQPIDETTVRYNSSIWPVIRRQMTEFRDRSAPFAKKFLSRQTS